MRNREHWSNTFASLIAAVLDFIFIFLGFLAATWIRFETDWIPIDPFKGQPTDYEILRSSLIATILFVFIFRVLGLYRRPHRGRFEDSIPRIIRAILTSFAAYIVMERVLNLQPPYSRYALAISGVTITFLVLLVRYISYRIEWHYARHLEKINHALILGTDAMAVKLKEAIALEPFLRSDIVGFIETRTEETADAEALPILGSLNDVKMIARENDVNQIILTDIKLPHEDMVELILWCEKNFINFNLVPDMFRILTIDLEMQNLNGVPIMGIRRWPLDYFWPRFAKRGFDFSASAVGLLLCSPFMALAGLAIKISSPGPVFYRQTRCGESGRSFTMYKLRTMRQDAEADGQPGWTQENDPRRTKIGSFLRKSNLDELPQLWNVLRGDMSLVGPRPERPYFVEQFQEVIDRYMRRHVAKPGLTGWAQVNGLRGDTSIEERIKYDLYYLEHWSLAFDFKIIIKTLFSQKNAY